MKTFFSRHTTTLDVDYATRQLLWNERRVAIHYPDVIGWNRSSDPDSTSLNLSDYQPAARKALKALLDLAKSGGYVYAEHHPYREALVGYVEPNSDIEFLTGTWGSRLGRDGQPALLKSLRLTKSRILHPFQIPVVSVARPRRGTIMKWPSIGKAIENIVEDKTDELSLSDLPPTQQEIMCSEFLRTDAVIALGLPRFARMLLLGGTMRDLDIVGIAVDGSKVIAQVTYGKLNATENKLIRLKQYAGPDCHLIYFCKCDSPVVIDSVHIIPIQMVFRESTSDSIGKSWLEAACRA